MFNNRLTLFSVTNTVLFHLLEHRIAEMQYNIDDCGIDVKPLLVGYKLSILHII